MGLIFLALCVIAFILFKIYRHFVPAAVTPPAGTTTATGTATPPAPETFEQKVWTAVKFLGVAIFLFLIFTCGLFFWAASNDGGSQTVDVRDNYGVIQQNDVDITNNNTTVVQPVQRVVRVVTQTVETADGDGSDENFQKKQSVKTIRKKYLDTNGDPTAITVDKTVSVTTMLR